VESWSSVSLSSTVLCQNTECCYLMISIEHGSLGTCVHVGFFLYIAHLLSLSVAFFISSSTLTAVVWTHGNFLAVFPKVPRV
jgi:hypothetical protein